LEQVDQFLYLGGLVMDDGECSKRHFTIIKDHWKTAIFGTYKPGGSKVI